jgi:hypothetical protein
MKEQDSPDRQVFGNGRISAAAEIVLDTERLPKES